jgi:hypothetical protein
MPTDRINAKSKLISIRLPFEMIDALKRLADRLGRPYQTVMKEAIDAGMPIVKTLSKTAPRPRTIRRDAKSYKAPHLKAALARLKKR